MENQTWLASAVFTHNSTIPVCLFSLFASLSLSLPLSLSFCDCVIETVTVPIFLMQPAEFCSTKMPFIVLDVCWGEKLSLVDRPSVGEANNGFD